MTAPADPVDPSKLIEQADLLLPYAVRVAATLRLADLLAAGNRGLAELAGAAGADPDALGRLLRLLATRGIFHEPSPGIFGLTPMAQLLCSDHPAGMRDWFDLGGVNARMERAFAGLLDVVRSGEPAYPKLFGHSFWEDAVADPSIAASFDSVMAAQVSWSAGMLAAAYDWSEVAHVVDVGGGNGSLLAAVLGRHPHLRGTLVELPSAIAAARDRLATAGLGQRCTLVEGSFFDELPAGADVYLVANILHDWSDEQAATILDRCVRAAGQRGRVLVVERVADDLSDAHIAAYDLRMLVVFGGRERTLEQFARLCTVPGFAMRAARRLPTGLCLLEYGVKPPAAVTLA